MGRGVFLLPGHPGGISTAHSRNDIDTVVSESGNFAERATDT
jgi:hypothetical protein